MSSPELETATIGGGCFWCTEAVFQRIAGVASVVSGYAGGHDPAPTYSAICTGTTGHAEVIKIDFNPEQVSYEDLLAVFFATHDPTTENRQGADVGTQYRSTIMWHTSQQRETAERVIQQLNESGSLPGPVVTEVVEAPEFFPAEGYHQQYYQMNPAQPYCIGVVGPKVEKFKKLFANLERES